MSSTPTAQRFEALRDAFFDAHRAYCTRALADEPPAHEDDLVGKRLTETETAFMLYPAPDLDAFVQKMLVAREDMLEGGVNKDEINALYADMERVTGAKFNPAVWLHQWTERSGGYVVQDGTAKLICPTDYSPQRRELIGKLDSAGSSAREALAAHILEQGQMAGHSFDAALAAYQNAVTAEQAYERDVLKPSCDAENRPSDEAATEHDRLLGVCFEMVKILAVTPAPNAAALKAKYEAIEAQDGQWMMQSDKAIYAALKNDALRLAGEP